MADPIGVAIPVNNDVVNDLQKKWDSTEKPITKWWSASTAKIQVATSFLLHAVGVLIRIVDVLPIDGKDKKASVLAVIDKLYDLVIVGALPLWAKPFSSYVKQYIVYSVISSAIDYLVAQIRSK